MNLRIHGCDASFATGSSSRAWSVIPPSCTPPFRADLREPLTPHVRALAIYSRSDGCVSWRACLDPCARQIEVESSHTGMSVNLEAYRVLAEIFEEEPAWSG
jgi:hypothetical protein